MEFRWWLRAGAGRLEPESRCGVVHNCRVIAEYYGKTVALSSVYLRSSVIILYEQYINSKMGEAWAGL